MVAASDKSITIETENILSEEKIYSLYHCFREANTIHFAKDLLVNSSKSLLEIS